MRLFVGIAIPEEVRAGVAAFVDGLRPLARLKWAEMARMHITTKFIGHRPQEDVAGIRDALSRLPPRCAFEVTLRGLGWFPHVLWMGVAAPELVQLANDTDLALSERGIARDERAYVPHLTLARAPRGASLSSLRRAVVEQGSSEWGTFTVDAFTLYESRQGYFPLATFALDRRG